jgi:maltooligosyltrehalose trehalohydrolase
MTTDPRDEDETMIELWAPKARRVRMRSGAELGRETELTAAAGGWWQAPVELADGERYGFVLDDGELRPDPRSRRQPDGVHAASAWVDTAAFAWTDAAWTGRQLAGGLIYELHLGTFTAEGTLDAAIGRLPHLVELGVTHIELLPVNGFNGVWNWGYDGVAWYAVHEAYGGPTGYARFVDAAHAAGLAVVQDVVYNHLGPSGNYLPEFGPYLREGTPNTWGDSVDLDEPAVRGFIVENALMWLRDYHVDALRLDAVHALHDERPVHILREMAEAVDALSAHVGRPLTLIAESDMNDPTLILPREAGGYGIAAQWSDDWHHAVHVALTGETSGYYADFAASDALEKVWTRGFFHDGTYSSFRERHHGHPIPAEVPTWRLVTFAQDHDQIGNRAAGDRLSATLSPDRLAVAAVLTLTAPGTPMLFMGEEWGASTPWPFFTSHPEEWLGEAVRTGRAAEFAKTDWDESVVPDPQDPATFRSAKLVWEEAETGDHGRILALYRELARLRRERPELTDPASAHLSAAIERADAAPAARRFVLGRGALRIIVNLAPEPWELPLVVEEEVLLATVPIAPAAGRVTVPADAAVVLGPPLP